MDKETARAQWDLKCVKEANRRGFIIKPVERRGTQDFEKPQYELTFVPGGPFTSDTEVIELVYKGIKEKDPLYIKAYNFLVAVESLDARRVLTKPEPGPDINMLNMLHPVEPGIESWVLPQLHKQ
jgi:hypothetical protein